MKSLEDDMFFKLSTIRTQMSEASSKEDLRFEKNKRRMSDFHTSLNAINHKLDFLFNNLQPNDPSEAIYNNPMMNNRQQHHVPTRRTPAPESQTDAPRHNVREGLNRSPETLRENVPQWEKDFPFIKHVNFDPEMRKELWKSIPRNSEWEQL